MATSPTVSTRGKKHGRIPWARADTRNRSSDLGPGSNSSKHADASRLPNPSNERPEASTEIPPAPTMTTYPELDRYRHVLAQVPCRRANIEVPFQIATHNLPPPTPRFSATSNQLSALSASPSPRFSESPSPGAYSRNTTPTSISSQCPGLLVPLTTESLADPTQTKAPVSRKRADSISNETGSASADPQALAAVRDGDGKGQHAGKRRRERRLAPAPPSPPPRKSSRAEAHAPFQQPVEASRQLAVVSSRATPPRRPCRDGTSSLHSQVGMGMPPPTVQSHLSSTSLAERRQSGDQRRSRALGAATGLTPAPGSGTAEAIPDVPPPAPGRFTSLTSRYPVLRRIASKATSGVAPVGTKERPTRTGPAAGMGHEGQGRLAAVRGSSAAAARGPVGTISSQESLSASQSYDQFLRDRMTPVVIVGGGEVIENRQANTGLNRTESDQSLPVSRRLKYDSKNSLQVSMLSTESPRNPVRLSSTLLGPRQSMPKTTNPSSGLGNRRPSDSSESEALAMECSLAARRSMQRPQTGDQNMPKLPKTIVTSAETGVPCVTSEDAMFDPFAKSADKPTTTPSKRLTKRARSFRTWNFFGHSHSQPTTDAKDANRAKTIAATVTAAAPAKPVAFYTMMEFSEQEDADTLDPNQAIEDERGLDLVGSQAQKARHRRQSAARRPSNDGGSGTPNGRRPSRDGPTDMDRTAPSPGPKSPLRERRTVTSPRSPDAQAATTTVAGTEGAAEDSSWTRQGTARPSRLPQVGRIPKVISARPEQSSSTSFSRPFHRIGLLSPPPAKVADPDSVAKGATPEKPSSPEPMRDELFTARSDTDILERKQVDAPTEMSPEPERAEKEELFARFSHRKHSQGTVTTWALSGSGTLDQVNASAVFPTANAPVVEDEIWDEYNDLLGDDSYSAPPRTGSSAGKPFHLELSGKMGIEIEEPLDSPLLHPPAMHSLSGPLTKEREDAASSTCSYEETEQINALLGAGSETGSEPQSQPDAEPQSEPLGPVSLSEFVPAHGDVNMGVDKDKPRLPAPCKKLPPLPAQPPQLRDLRRSEASGDSPGSEDNSPVSQVNLRVESMTVSKWLTFGHVLFSPARDELVPGAGPPLKSHSVLVIDGLGNDDWSYYASGTYPAATFFNLSSRAPPVRHRRSIAAMLPSPTNHHQVRYGSHLNKLPHGPESFTTVVYRFPVAAPEAHYHNVVAEARRVLRPGGFVELVVLDVDLVNMGPRCRRAVRCLKERIRTAEPDTCPGAASDTVARLLGRTGFTDIKTCRVGVPVASAIARPAGAALTGEEGASADARITKMVTRVGRWWYTRCYEHVAAGASIWADRTLLAECEEWGTKLKLMVCHARVPDVRRMASL